MFAEGVYPDESGRVRVERGPVSLVLSAFKGGIAQTRACLDAAGLVDGILAEIKAALPLLFKPWPETGAGSFACAGPDGNADFDNGRELLPCRMWRAAKDTGHPEMTPMCAVAGAVADALAETVFTELGGSEAGPEQAVRVIVSNGGDVSLRLSPGAEANVGLVPALWSSGADEVVKIKEQDPVRGVATSGLGGRGLTQGVADAVTAFAASGALADALATRLGNSSRIESPRVSMALAGTLRPGCDIASLPVTVSVGRLTKAEKEAALEGVRRAAEPLIAEGKLYAMRATVQGARLWLPSAWPAINHGGSYDRADS